MVPPIPRAASASALCWWSRGAPHSSPAPPPIQSSLPPP
ncbi:hypothetical protein Cantr_02222 [Candida viswanathii]|uniref:Uncharacterized protein n=1 Tax=Candida viswanathii TaxID=5486 RepID=A0A367YNB7_9ASCO|nr:hypothetical protein Cantr_02222 [Candida viswanathii]